MPKVYRFRRYPVFVIAPYWLIIAFAARVPSARLLRWRRGKAHSATGFEIAPSTAIYGEYGINPTLRAITNSR